MDPDPSPLTRRTGNRKSRGNEVSTRSAFLPGGVYGTSGRNGASPACQSENRSRRPATGGTRMCFCRQGRRPSVLALRAAHHRRRVRVRIRHRWRRSPSVSPSLPGSVAPRAGSTALRLTPLNSRWLSLGFCVPKRLIEPIGGAHMFGVLSNVPSSLYDELWHLQQEVDELFGSSSPPLGIRSLPRGSFPAVNVGLTPERVDIYLFAPGIDPKRLDISIQQNLLTIAGSRELRAEEEANFYRQERFSGEFRRVISLPEDVDPERVQAKYFDGIVQIGVQRRESARPRQIEIQ